MGHQHMRTCQSVKKAAATLVKCGESFPLWGMFVKVIGITRSRCLVQQSIARLTRPSADADFTQAHIRRDLQPKPGQRNLSRGDRPSLRAGERRKPCQITPLEDRILRRRLRAPGFRQGGIKMPLQPVGEVPFRLTMAEDKDRWIAAHGAASKIVSVPPSSR